MFEKGVEVPVPKSGKRLKRQGKNTYVYLVLKRKKAGVKGSKDVVEEVGKVTRPGFMAPNENYFRRHPEAKASPTEEPGAMDDQSKIGAVCAIDSVASSLGMKACLELAFGEDAGLILSLASYYAVARDSAACLYADFMFDHFGVADTIASEASISRLFNQRMPESKIDSFRSAYLARRWSEARRGKRGKARLYVDLDSTSENVSSRGCLSAEFGKPKVDEGLPQVNMAYFYDRSTGCPIFYDTFYGSITDLSYCVKGIEQFLLALGKDAKSVGYDFIMDRGYFSAANLSALSAKGLSFACMGKSNAVFRALVRDFGAQAKSAASLIGMGSYGMRLEGRAFDSGNENAYHLYLYFDSLKQTQEKAGVESKLIEAKKALEGKRTDKGGGLKRTYGRYLAIEETKAGRIKSVRVNAESVDAMLAEAGFFWVASTMEMEPSEMLEAYRARDDIEKCFRIVKAESDLNKLYAQGEGALRAKTAVAFVTASIRSEITHLTREVSARRHGISVQKMLLSLDKIIMHKTHGVWSLKYALTAEQQEIMNALGVKKSDLQSIVDRWNSKQKDEAR